MPHYAESNAFESNAQRVMGICNACRYCEGFCAVFPAHRTPEPPSLQPISLTSPIFATIARNATMLARIRRRMNSR